MAIQISVPEKPVILVNDTPVANKEVETGVNSYSGNRNATVFNGPVNISFTGPAGSTIRYTFNSKKVNLGSPVYSSPISVSQNGNGYDSDSLTIRAKAYVNGEVSGTSEAVIKIV